jgi:hypothetical protein
MMTGDDDDIPGFIAMACFNFVNVFMYDIGV